LANKPIIHTRYKRHKRLKKPVKRGILLVGILLLLVIAVPHAVKYITAHSRQSYGTIRVDHFEDINAVHLRFAKKYGISPLKSVKDYQGKKDELLKKGRLVRIADTRYYKLNRLTHSHPYLVPEAAELLTRIGKRFQEKLENHGMDEYRFRVTSLLRTGESQKRLSHVNGNATSNSAHLYGTTFDITYKSLVKRSVLGREKIVPDAAAIRLLSETIGELRKDNRLLVVTETNEACFHITVR